jgi:hypothetical protein
MGREFNAALAGLGQTFSDINATNYARKRQADKDIEDAANKAEEKRLRDIQIANAQSEMNTRDAASAEKTRIATANTDRKSVV